MGASASQAGSGTRWTGPLALLGPGDRVLELGCGTGTTAPGCRACATLSCDGHFRWNDRGCPKSAPPALSSACLAYHRARKPRSVRRNAVRTQFWDSTIFIWSATCPARCAASMPYLQRTACSFPKTPCLRDMNPLIWLEVCCPRCACSAKHLMQASFGRRAWASIYCRRLSILARRKPCAETRSRPLSARRRRNARRINTHFAICSGWCFMRTANWQLTTRCGHPFTSTKCGENLRIWRRAIDGDV